MSKLPESVFRFGNVFVSRDGRKFQFIHRAEFWHKFSALFDGDVGNQSMHEEVLFASKLIGITPTNLAEMAREKENIKFLCEEISARKTKIWHIDIYPFSESVQNHFKQKLDESLTAFCKRVAELRGYLTPQK